MKKMNKMNSAPNLLTLNNSNDKTSSSNPSSDPANSNNSSSNSGNGNATLRGKEGLLLWIQQQTHKYYPKAQVRNFTTDFQDGTKKSL